MSFRVLVTHTALALTALSAGAEAQPLPRQPQTRPPATEAAFQPCEDTNALAALGCELAQQLSPHQPGAVVALEVTQGENGGATLRGEALAERLAQVVAGTMAVTNRGTAKTLGAARARALGTQPIVVLSPTIRGASLDVTGDVYTGRESFWDRPKSRKSTVLGHAFATRAIDAEIKSFFQVTPLVVTRIDKGRLPSGAALALACGDLDGNGSLELALATRHSLSLGTLRGGRFATVRHVRLDALSPVSATPLREPLSTLNLAAGRYLDVGSSDREFTRRLNPAFEPIAKSPRQIPWPAFGCAAREGLGLSSTPQDCAAPHSATPAIAGGPVDAVSGAHWTSLNGAPLEAIASRRMSDGVLEVTDSRGRQTALPGAGAQVALGDLNQDGQLEVVVSRNTQDRKQDAVDTYTWNDVGLTLSFSFDVPSGVDALAVCPPEDTGLSPIALASGHEIWVVR